MKENEFDIRVRNLLLGATEEVSPEVWDGIVAGLNRKRRIVAMRWWGALAGAAAAAAVVAGIVFVQPRDGKQSNPVVNIAEAPKTEAPAPVSTEESAPVTESTPLISQQIAAHGNRLAQADPASEPLPIQAEQPVREEPAQAQPEQAQPEQLQPEQPQPAQQTKPQPAAGQASSDNALLDRLAYEETHRQSVGSGFSVSAFGNLQDMRRGSSPDGVLRPIAAPEKHQGEYIEEGQEVSFGLPFSAGIGVKYNFTPRLALGTGIRYTNLSRSFEGNYYGEGFSVQETNINNSQHWLGVPLQLSYDFINYGRWRVHGFGGASVEFLLDNDFLVHGSQKDIHFHQKSSVPQFSADFGVGVEFKLTPAVGLYLDPGFRYFFRTDLQPRSLRTIQPFRFDIEAGVRFSLGRN